MRVTVKHYQKTKVIGWEKKSLETRGFSLVEMLIVIGIMGILMLASYPSVMNTLETRDLENQIREIQTALQQAKFLAVREKMNHRVHFLNTRGYWTYALEREATPTVWSSVPRTFQKAIPQSYTVVVNLPNGAVIYSPIGFVLSYSSTQRSVSIQSPKITAKGQPGTRMITVYIGGSSQMTKAT